MTGENHPFDHDENLPEYIRVTDVLDLHGTDPAIIPDMIESFIANAMELNLKRLRIIHGKGKSRLKHMTINILIHNEYVLRYYDAPPDIGGWGATIVELI